MERQTVMRIGRVIAVAGLAVAAFFFLRDKLPSWSAVTAALANANQGWLLVALGAEFASMGMFARQQRRLLRGFGVPISMPRAGAISWSRSAIAISFPAGSALSAGWAFRQFRASGASRATAAAVMVLSGLVSVLALSGLYLTGLLATLLSPLATLRPGAIATLGLGISLIVVTAGVLLTRVPHPHGGHHLRHEPGALASLGQRWAWLGRLLAQLAEIRTSASQVQGRHWALALLAAAMSWLADLGCLAAVALAFDLPISPTELGLIYLGVQVVRQIPLTPGGVGMIEASLLAGLIAAGAPEAAAAATVVVYRVLSCWMVIPLGALAWASLRRRPNPGETGGALGWARLRRRPTAVPADAPQLTVRLSPSTVTVRPTSGLVAGPPTTEPSTAENELLWQKQLILES